MAKSFSPNEKMFSVIVTEELLPFSRIGHKKFRPNEPVKLSKAERKVFEMEYDLAIKNLDEI